MNPHRLPSSLDRFGDLIAFPFERPDWEPRFLRWTLAFAALMLFVPPLAEMLEKGIAFQVARRVLAEGKAPSLPEALPWRQIFRDGARWWLVSTLYSLPALLVVVLGAAGLYCAYGLPEDGLANWRGWTEGGPVLAALVGAAVLLGALGGWLSNAAVMHMARHGSLRAAFDARGWLAVLRRNLRGFLRAFFTLLGFGVLLAVFQWLVSIPAALLIVGPALAAAFFSLYHRMVAAAVYALAYSA